MQNPQRTSIDVTSHNQMSPVSSQFVQRRTPRVRGTDFGRADQGPKTDCRDHRHNKAPRGKPDSVIVHGKAVAIASSAPVTPGPPDAK
jgi:hypothetical protein